MRTSLAIDVVSCAEQGLYDRLVSVFGREMEGRGVDGPDVVDVGSGREGSEEELDRLDPPVLHS